MKVLIFLVVLFFTSSVCAAEYYVYILKKQQIINGSNRASHDDKGDIVDVVLKTDNNAPSKKALETYDVKIVNMPSEQANELLEPLEEDMIVQNSYTFPVSQYQSFIDSYGFKGIFDKNFKIIKYSDDNGYRTVIYNYTLKIKTHNRRLSIDVDNLPSKKELTKGELDAKTSIKSSIDWVVVE